VAEERKSIAKDQAAREERAAILHLEQRAAKATFLSRLTAADDEDELTIASNAQARSWRQTRGSRNRRPRSARPLPRGPRRLEPARHGARGSG
jgi:hypothetical protein